MLVFHELLQGEHTSYLKVYKLETMWITLKKVLKSYRHGDKIRTINPHGNFALSDHTWYGIHICEVTTHFYLILIRNFIHIFYYYQLDNYELTCALYIESTEIYYFHVDRPLLVT